MLQEVVLGVLSKKHESEKYCLQIYSASFKRILDFNAAKSPTNNLGLEVNATFLVSDTRKTFSMQKTRRCQFQADSSFHFKSKKCSANVRQINQLTP